MQAFVSKLIFLFLSMPGSAHILRLFYVILSVLFLVPGSLCARIEMEHVRQVDTLENSLDPFGEDKPMSITLTFDIKKFQREKHKGEYLPVHFHYQLNDTLSLEKDLQLKVRGKTRINHCSLPPFWLYFRQTDVENEELREISRVKIVTHCKNSQAYEKYVLKEFLCYKIYNIISPLSFRVRLVRMSYVDTGRDNKVSEGWAFMIEPVEMLAQRFNAEEIKDEGLLSRQMRPVEMNMMALFQYMIGNPDYSVPHRHNVKILKLPGYGTGGYTAVPYDFDYSGLVNTHYALPAEFLDINSVRERYYLGPCRPDVDIDYAIGKLNLYREEILQLVWDFEYLDQKDKKSVLTYLEEYFDQAEHKKSLIFGIQRTCL
jgi:hypothetical protein